MTKKRQRQITGVFGLPIDKQGQVLISLRHDPKNSLAHHKWQIAGGGVEFGESVEETLVRELQEELDVTPKILYPYPILKTHVWDYKYNQVHIQMVTFLVHIGHQIITANPEEIADTKWILPEEIFNFDTLPQVAEIIAETAKILTRYKSDFMLE